MNKIKQRRHNPFAGLLVALVLFTAFALQPGEASAQWQTSGSHINNTNTGNVGIGSTNTNPLTRLSITPSTTEPKITLWDGGSTGPHYGFGVSGGQLNYHVVDGNASHVFFQGGRNGDGIPLMTIKGSGNVGIGTTNPTYLLDVSGGFFRTTFNTQSLPASSLQGGLGVSWNRSSGNAEVNFYNLWENPVVAYTFSQKTGPTSAWDLMTILGNGNVGIGTSTPAYLLDVTTGFFRSTFNTQSLPASSPLGGLAVSWNRGGGSAEVNFYNLWENPGIAYLFSKKTGPTTAADLMSILGNGNIGIGTANPTYKMDVFGSSASQFHLTSNGTDSGLYLFANGNDAYYLGGASFNGSQWIAKAANAEAFSQASGSFVFYSDTGLTPGSAFTPTERMRIQNGFVGIGTAGPAAVLHVVGTANTNGIFEGGSSTHSLVQFRNAGLSRGYFGFVNSGTTGLGFFNASGNTINMLVTDSGNVGIGTTSPTTKLHVVGAATVTGTVSTGSINATGDITATGNIAAKYQDLAEWVPASRAIPAGTVVVLDAEQSNHVRASTHSYDTRVAGVISANPGVILGEAGEGKVKVATTGRVRVKVDATIAPIRVGDLLVTSDKEGIAMRSQPINVGGASIHRPGTLIGKALEPLNKGVGEILVLLSLQ